MTYAGFWIRVGASIIDTIIMFILFIPLAMMIYNVNYVSREMSTNNMSSYSGYFHVDTTGGFLLNYVLPAVAVMVFWLYKSATLGKLLLKLKIVDAKTGNKPTILQFVIRYLGYFLSSIFFLGFIWIAFDRKKQGFHDKIAGTVVVKDVSSEEVSFESEE